MSSSRFLRLSSSLILFFVFFDLEAFDAAFFERDEVADTSAVFLRVEAEAFLCDEV